MTFSEHETSKNKKKLLPLYYDIPVFDFVKK